MQDSGRHFNVEAAAAVIDQLARRRCVPKAYLVSNKDRSQILGLDESVFERHISCVFSPKIGAGASFADCPRRVGAGGYAGHTWSGI